MRRTIDTQTIVFTYDQWTPVMESDASGKPRTINMYGLGDDEILYSGGPSFYFYKSDPMGNVRFVLNGAGTIVEKYTYDAFGAATVTQFNGSSPTGNRFMYSGREFMPSLGLYDLRNRVYDPEMGRFYQTDPIGFAGDPTNLYRFCGHNPLLGGDPTGLFSAGDFFGSIGDVFSSIFSNANFGSRDSNPSGYGSFGSDYNPLGFTNDSPIGAGHLGANPWSIYATTNLFFGTLTPIGAWAPQGQFTISGIPAKFPSGVTFQITFVCQTCSEDMVYRLDQDIRGLVPVYENGKYVRFPTE